MSTSGSDMKKLLIIISFAVMGLASPLSAASIVGTLNITGTVTVDIDTIDWQTAEGVENLVLVGFSTGYFEDLFDAGISPSYGSSIDLNDPTPFPVADFLHDFKENPIDLPTEYDNLSFTLDSIVSPVAPACTGSEDVDEACSFGVFTLTQTAGGSVDVRMDVTGTFIDPEFEDTPATGIYTTQLSATAIQDIMEIILAGDSITADYSANFTSIPEPATLLTFGAGTALLAAYRRRRAARAA